MLSRILQLSLSLLLVVSCASVETAKDIQPYIPDGVTSVSIKFGRVWGAHSAAECFILDFNPNVVIINEVEWNRMSDKQRRWIINHELGHCLHGIIDHDNTLDSNGCPTSVMFWQVPDNKCLKPN